MNPSSCFLRSTLLTTGLGLAVLSVHAQVPGRQMHWTADGNAYATIEQPNPAQDSQGDLVRTDIRTGRKTTLLFKDKLRQPGSDQALTITDFAFTPDSTNLLIFTNTARVWRYNTRGDYFLVNRSSGQMRQLGKGSVHV